MFCVGELVDDVDAAAGGGVVALDDGELVADVLLTGGGSGGDEVPVDVPELEPEDVDVVDDWPATPAEIDCAVPPTVDLTSVAADPSVAVVVEGTPATATPTGSVGP